mgnify:CR=1 FL=1
MTLKQWLEIDTRFLSAYRCALALITILIRANGFRILRDQHHYRTIEALRFVLPETESAYRVFLQQCRKKRNELSYCTVGVATENDLKELLNMITIIRKAVSDTLSSNFPELVP